MPRPLATIGRITEEAYTLDELRAAINYIRSLPTGYRWSWRTLRRERYGPDVVLLSWLEHAEDLLSRLERSWKAHGGLLSKYHALYARCLMAEGHALVNEGTIDIVREHFTLYEGPPGYEPDSGRGSER